MDKPMNEATDLHTAAQEGDVKLVEELIAKGADVNAKDKYGETPLHSALKKAQSEMVQLLIAKGADVNAKDKYGATPLFEAAPTKCPLRAHYSPGKRLLLRTRIRARIVVSGPSTAQIGAQLRGPNRPVRARI